MSDRFQAILDAALALPEAERELLVEQLLETLPPGFPPLSDKEMFAELERRHAEMEAGLVKPIPWSEFRWEEDE
jgi:putative addiction module component (TIGR02574 family)